MYQFNLIINKPSISASYFIALFKICLPALLIMIYTELAIPASIGGTAGYLQKIPNLQMYEKVPESGLELPTSRACTSRFQEGSGHFLIQSVML
jgi:hypothetical protein